MKLATTSLVALMLGFAATASQADGVNLYWNDCMEAGVMNKTFACNTNSGNPFVLVGSYVAPSGIGNVVGLEAVLDFGSESPSTPSWWLFVNAGSCRQMAVSANADFTSDAYCLDPWSGQALGGLAGYALNVYGISCRSRLQLAFAIPEASSVPAEPDAEYYGFKVAISRAKTVGTDACAGCLTPMVILLSSIKLAQAGSPELVLLQNPAANNMVSWQNGQLWNTCIRTPTRNSTWGAIKAQYH
ncbi:MAG: hypothetical protein U0704_05255 [Candidatus Eisenbacteria bacterium]